MKYRLLTWLLLIMTAGFAILVLGPKIRHVRALTVEKEAKLRLVANKKTRQLALEELGRRFADQPKRVEALIATLPQEPEVPEILSSIEALTQLNRLTLHSLVPQTDESEHQVNLTIVGEGELGGVESFIRGVGENSRPMSVSSLSLNKGTATTLSFNLEIAVPYQGEGKEGGR